jgi:hypothetical protein
MSRRGQEDGRGAEQDFAKQRLGNVANAIGVAVCQQIGLAYHRNDGASRLIVP